MLVNTPCVHCRDKEICGQRETSVLCSVHPPASWVNYFPLIGESSRTARHMNWEQDFSEVALPPWWDGLCDTGPGGLCGAVLSYFSLQFRVLCTHPDKEDQTDL